MRITKDLASSIAKKLVEKTKLSVELLKKDYQQVVLSLYNSTIPKDVIETYKKHPDYFNTSRNIAFSGHGFNYESVVVSETIICNGSYQRGNLKLTAAISEKITKSKRKLDKAIEQYDLLLRETESALLALRTYKNIEENIPAAKPFLPPPMSNALVCNFDSLNRKISNQPEVSKELVEAK